MNIPGGPSQGFSCFQSNLCTTDVARHEGHKHETGLPCMPLADPAPVFVLLDGPDHVRLLLQVEPNNRVLLAGGNGTDGS